MDNFWQALEMVDMTQPEVKHEYRLYYDKENGTPLYYSMEKLPGTYIKVGKEVYLASRLDFEIEDGKIKYYKTTRSQILEITNNGTPCHPDNVMIVSQKSKIKWSLKTINTE